MGHYTLIDLKNAELKAGETIISLYEGIEKSYITNKPIMIVNAMNDGAKYAPFYPVVYPISTGYNINFGGNAFTINSTGVIATA